MGSFGRESLNIMFTFFYIICAFLRYVDKLKCRKEEYQKLVSNKQEEQIHLKEYVFKTSLFNYYAILYISYLFLENYAKTK